MDCDETIRLGRTCSVWGCEDLIVAEALCSAHLALNCSPEASGPEPSAQRPLHKPKRTRRFALGRASARSAKNSTQQTACSPKQRDGALAHFRQELPTRPATHHLPSYGVSIPVPENPSVQTPADTAPSRQNRATIQDASASTVAVESIPPRPREPYFVLNPDVPSIDKNSSAFPRQQAARDLPERRHASKETNLEGNPAVVEGLVHAGLEFASTLRLSFAQTASATHDNVLSATPSVRAGDLNMEELPSITVANKASRKESNPVTSRRREASTINVVHESSRHTPLTGDIPLHLSPKKRKADVAGVQPSTQGPSHIQGNEAHSTSSASKRQTRSRSSAQSGDGTQTARSGKPSKAQSSKLGNDQGASHLRSSKRVRTSKGPTPASEIAQTRTNGRIENLGQGRGGYPDDNGRHGSIPISQQPQQPKPRETRSTDGRESRIPPPLPTPETDVTVEDQTTPAAGQSAVQELSTAKRHAFDSEAFDAMIYRQSSLHPPPGVPSQPATRPKTPTKVPSAGVQRQYLAVNPTIHMVHNRSDAWHKQKALEIQARGGRKAWFGKVIERRRWMRANERAKEEEQKAVKTSNKKPKRADPQPWSYDRIMDFGDVPEEELPEDVLQNPAWVKACAWHRENEAKRVLRDRAAKEAHREAWNYAESIMKEATLASEGSRGPSKQR
ncbi:hypothetical protein HDV57DRAFT_246202 [Trichoderma longibrachiatum]|uniref:Uncharacterized protein n=1 Tax=Trichoderma longibrachiatum ATCC 18648 TaxID=983965 RepID=A0A2T4C9W1_TRILO|nr:hypothetical protein M440DRAFT_1328393 [Trichoderma longibrachiatum ATCC 18648]